eukprot:751306-Hanusia_phi.AAC.1
MSGWGAAKRSIIRGPKWEIVLEVLTGRCGSSNQGIVCMRLLLILCYYAILCLLLHNHAETPVHRALYPLKTAPSNLFTCPLTVGVGLCFLVEAKACDVHVVMLLAIGTEQVKASGLGI